MSDGFICQYLQGHEQLEAVTTCTHQIFNVCSTVAKKNIPKKLLRSHLNYK